jgi:hypothetical protein
MAIQRLTSLHLLENFFGPENIRQRGEVKLLLMQKKKAFEAGKDMKNKTPVKENILLGYILFSLHTTISYCAFWNSSKE